MDKNSKEVKMNYFTRYMMILVMILLATITVGGVYASTVTVPGGQIPQVGDEISVPITLDTADNGLIYYAMRITVGDPTIAQITKVDFPPWATVSGVNPEPPASAVVVTAGEIQSSLAAFHNQAGAENVPIATITYKGLKAGSTSLSVQFSVQDLGGAWVYPTIQAGTIQVIGTAPTTTTPITVSSTPSAATVYLDGVAIGPTPLTIPTVSYGTHTLLLTKTGYQDSSNTVTVSASTNTFAYVLTAVPVVTTTPITVSSTPSVATVYLDGVAIGPTPLTIPSVSYGTHTLLLTKTGYQDSSNTVTVSASTNTFAYVLTTTPLPTGPTGQVYFSSIPQGATIIIDGVPANSVTPYIMAVPVGTHQAIFKLAGYNDLQAGFTAQQNSMTTVSRRLIPGSVIIPVTTGTTVITTVPTITATQTIVVPTTAPGTRPSFWSYRITWPSWLRTFVPTW